MPNNETEADSCKGASGRADLVCGRAGERCKGLLGQLTLALQQQFDLGWCQPPRCGRDTELLIQ